MKTDEAETKRNSLHGETEKSFLWNGKSLASLTFTVFDAIAIMIATLPCCKFSTVQLAIYTLATSDDIYISEVTDIRIAELTFHWWPDIWILA